MRRLYLALALLPLLAAAGVAHASLILAKLVDPPILASNLSGKPVTLTWQTIVPGVALTPPRSATIAAGARDEQIEPGITWIVERRDDGKVKFPLDNYVYVSRVDDGQYLAQAVLKSEIFVSTVDIEKHALRVTVDADGRITLAPAMVK